MSAEPSARPAGPASQSLLPPAARQVASVRTFHGDRVADPYAWLASKEDPETIAFLEAENAYTEALTADQEGLRETVFGGDQGAHPGDRPVGPLPQGGLVVLPPDGRGPAVRAAVPLPGAAGRHHAAAAGRGRAAGRRGGPAGRERAGRGVQLLLPRRVQRQPGRAAAGVLDRLFRRRALHAADQGPGDRRACCRTRYPAPSTAPRGRWTARRCSTSRSTTPGGRGGCGGTRSGRRTPTTR